ncbi:PDZ domain-containing protein 8 isoform X2 [Drosophila biarmipes]|nr:PDZ domain-containing protein 8 isoform X2 [Drosophila biarmipes]
MAYPGASETYCTITLAPVPFIEANQRDSRNVLISMDVFIHKAKNQQIGIVFKQSGSQVVRIESVLPNTPACKSNLQAGDVLVAIEGRPVTTIQQIAKVVKTLQATVFSLRIERIIPGIIRNDAILEDFDKYDDLGDLPSLCQPKADGESEAAPPAEPVPPKHLVVKPSLSGTPTNSPKKSNLIAKAIKKTMSRDAGDKDKDKDRDKDKDKDKDRDKDKDKDKDKEKGRDETEEPVNYFYQHSTIDSPFSPLIHMDDVCSFQLDNSSRFLNVCVFGKSAGESVLLGYNNVQIGQILVECSETSLNQCLKQISLNPASLQAVKMHPLSNQSGFNPNLCFGDILFGFSWLGNPNLTVGNGSLKSGSSPKSQPQTRSERVAPEDQSHDSAFLKVASTPGESSTSIDSSSATPGVPRAHDFVRTHFNRATQCDFCGKKIWLKDAMQCQECSMSCHKKCIVKCQMATVCGPVDCSSSTATMASRPEFTITQADSPEILDGSSTTGSAPLDETSAAASASGATAASGGDQSQIQTPTAAGLDVHRSSLTGMLAQGIKRQASNLDIPGIVSSLTGSGQQMNSKSLPPSPQHTPSRKSSIVEEAAPGLNQNPFESVTQHLEALPLDCPELSFEQVIVITEPIIRHTRNEDLMNLAKSTSKHLYVGFPPDERVAKINELLTKLKVALDAETEGYTQMNDAEKATESSPWKSDRSDERVQALSIIMLYLCTGLQHAQGVVLQ